MRLETIRGDLWASYVLAIKQLAKCAHRASISSAVVAAALPNASSGGADGALQGWTMKALATHNYC
jgi:hypothetical protein